MLKIWGEKKPDRFLRLELDNEGDPAVVLVDAAGNTLFPLLCIRPMGYIYRHPLDEDQMEEAKKLGFQISMVDKSPRVRDMED